MKRDRRGMVIFDLDGTLTVPTLDFDAIRAEIGLPPGPILEALEHLGDTDRQRAEDILHRHEHQAAHGSQLQPGAAETISTLRRRGWPVAVLTRNTYKWTQVVLNKHGITVDGIRSRDDSAVKPSPEPILSLCTETASQPQASWMVGDHLFDLQSGHAAGCTTVLMVGNCPPPDYAAQANHVVTSLAQLVGLMDHSPSERV